MENTKQINDRTYSFGQIPALEAVKVEIAVARVIGEPLFKAFMDTKKTPGQDEEAAASAAGATAIGLLLSKMDPTELTETMKTVFSYVGFKSDSGQAKARIDINADFTGRNKELWLVFIQALRFNFNDFLPESLFASVRNVLPK